MLFVCYVTIDPENREHVWPDDIAVDEELRVDTAAMKPVGRPI